MTAPATNIGVLALQGSFAEHIAILDALPIPLNVTPIRTSEQLAQVSALIIPGGESTAISLLAARSTLLADLREFVQLAKDGKRSVWGTCAGMILLGEEVVGSKDGYEGLGGVDMRVVRNQWGRQSESFEHPLEIPVLANSTLPFQGVFIRAPVTHTLLSPSSASPDLQVLARVPRSLLPIPTASKSALTGQMIEPTELGPDADVVMLRQGGLLATSFHPELTGDTRVHEWWVRDMVMGREED